MLHFHGDFANRSSSLLVPVENQTYGPKKSFFIIVVAPLIHHIGISLQVSTANQWVRNKNMRVRYYMAVPVSTL
jgi:hypothetical protein